MELDRNPYMTDEEYELYIKEYAEWLDNYMLDSDAWWRDFDKNLELKK